MIEVGTIVRRTKECIRDTILASDPIQSQPHTFYEGYGTVRDIISHNGIRLVMVIWGDGVPGLCCPDQLIQLESQPKLPPMSPVDFANLRKGNRIMARKTGIIYELTDDSGEKITVVWGREIRGGIPHGRSRPLHSYDLASQRT